MSATGPAGEEAKRLACIAARAADEKKAEEQALALSRQDSLPITNLSAYIQRFWQSAQTAKYSIERKMLKALRQRSA